jgi:hypothetical protein
MDNAALAALTPAQLRQRLLNGDNPFGELTDTRRTELAALGIHDPLGYLTDDEWNERALRSLDPNLVEPIVFDIDTIDWKSLKHSFGVAEHAPKQIRALLTDDYLTAVVAWGDLPNLLLHQGSIGSATVAALPYFLRMLTSNAPHLHYMSLSFLCALAQATSPEDDSVTSPSDALRQALARYDRDIDVEMEEEMAYQRIIWDKLGSALPQVEAFLEDDIPEIRRVAQLLHAELSGMSTD